ncbi:IS256 family transposase [Streptomyces sp. MP131-18]|uniref:IS256 family transposase n=1 Tax=Streptomyces sp. MP131-18 TaxID=1857892 RepID=UPI00097BACE7|nr:IS256 family transposase [Streptomyces sp. MP131-18]ONK13130.1 Transposase [Streptomyces sp. MP131-18]
MTISGNPEEEYAGPEEEVLSLVSLGLSYAAIAEHFRRQHGVVVPSERIAAMASSADPEMSEWLQRPLDSVYVVMWVDAIRLKIRGTEMANRPVYVVFAIDVNGRRDILGLWVGDGRAESARFWLRVLTEVQNRGVSDVLLLACDGLPGLPQVVNTVWPEALVQRCIVHLVRRSWELAGKQRHWAKVGPALRRVFNAPTMMRAMDALEEFEDEWGERFPAIVKLWRKDWADISPFLELPFHVRRIVSSTNPVESLNAKIRKVSNVRIYFPDEASALRTLYLAMVKYWSPRSMREWPEALNVFHTYFPGRLFLDAD